MIALSVTAASRHDSSPKEGAKGLASPLGEVPAPCSGGCPVGVDPQIDPQFCIIKRLRADEGIGPYG